MKHFLFFACLFASLFVAAQNHTTQHDTVYETHSIHFYRFLPAGYDPSGSYKYPLIINIHGSGQVGADIFTTGLPKLIQNNATMKFTVNGTPQAFVVLIPQMITNSSNGNPLPFDHYFIDAMIDYGLRSLNIDPTRIFLTGGSLGAGEAWSYPASSAARARKLAGILPVSGAPYRPVIGDLCNITNNDVHVYAFHGQFDPIVPYDTALRARNYVNDTCPHAPSETPEILRTYTYPTDPHYGHTDTWDMAYDTTNAFQTPNMYQWMITTARAVGASLPVELVYFKGKNVGDANVLTWATAKEVNADRFDVLRSGDGEHFLTIGTVSASVNSTTFKEYTFKDVNAPKNKTYYRLNEVDRDQKSKLTAVISITNNNKPVTEVRFANPVHDRLQLTIDGNISGMIQVDITDMQGRLLQKTSFYKDRQSWTGTINVQQLSKGIYATRITNTDGQLSVSSFVKD